MMSFAKFDKTNVVFRNLNGGRKFSHVTNTGFECCLLSFIDLKEFCFAHLHDGTYNRMDE